MYIYINMEKRERERYIYIHRGASISHQVKMAYVKDKLTLADIKKALMTKEYKDRVLNRGFSWWGHQFVASAVGP